MWGCSAEVARRTRPKPAADADGDEAWVPVPIPICKDGKRESRLDWTPHPIPITCRYRHQVSSPMHGFQDTTGRTWAVVINVAAVKRVRGYLLNLDLYSLVSDGFKPLTALRRRPGAAGRRAVLPVPRRGRGPARERRDFGRALAGDALLHAADALVEELVDFSPTPGPGTA